MSKTIDSNRYRSFLGLAGYYQRFVDGFASIASPLTTLTKKSNKFEWLKAGERSFQILQDRLNFPVVLTLLDGTKVFLYIMMHPKWV